MLKTASASLLLGILVFLLTPRFSRGAWRGLGGGVRGSVGFDDKVRLGAAGFGLDPAKPAGSPYSSFLP